MRNTTKNMLHDTVRLPTVNLSLQVMALTNLHSKANFVQLYQQYRWVKVVEW